MASQTLKQKKEGAWLGAGAKASLEAITGRRVLGMSEDGAPSDEKAIGIKPDCDYAIVLDSGRVLYTGGFDSIAALLVGIFGSGSSALTNYENSIIHGTYDPMKAWCALFLDRRQIETVLDLRNPEQEDEVPRFGEVEFTPFAADAENAQRLDRFEHGALIEDVEGRLFNVVGYGPTQGVIEIADVEDLHSYVDGDERFTQHEKVKRGRINVQTV